MKLSDSRLLAAVAFCVQVIALGVISCSAADLSDAEVDELFSRHPESLWRPLAERWEGVSSCMDSPVENISIPLEYYPGGLVKARLYAEKSKIFPDGIVFATKVRINLYSVSGQLDGSLKADDCLFDRESSHGYCRGRVEVIKEADIIKGVGMYFSISNEFIKILSNCEIRTDRFKANLGRFL
jgi:hypothetical protein